MLALKTMISPTFQLSPDQLMGMASLQMQSLTSPEMTQKIENNSKDAFESDILKGAVNYTVVVYIYQQSMPTYGKNKALESMLVEIRDFILTCCIRFIGRPGLSETALFIIGTVIECRCFEKKYSTDLIFDLLKQIKALHLLWLAEVKHVSIYGASTEAFRKTIDSLLVSVTSLSDILFNINQRFFDDEDIFEIEIELDKLKSKIYKMLNKKPVQTPLFFSTVNKEKHLQPEKLLIEATDYFFDFDDTLYHLNEGVIKDEVALLVRLAHCLGMMCHIITARNDLIDHAEKWVLSYQGADRAVSVSRTAGSSVPQVMSSFGLSDIFNEQNIIYCNFKLVRQNEDGVPMILSEKHVKKIKVGDFKLYCDKKDIKYDKAVIFDDVDSVWDAEELGDTVKHFVNNNYEPLSFFYKLAFSLSQVVLFNETRNVDLRKFVAEALIALLVDKQPELYQPLSEKLNEFIARPKSTLS